MMKILIAEDNPITRRLLEVKLLGWGYDVVAVWRPERTIF